MPHTNRQAPKPAPKPFAPAQFINITLQPDQIAAIKAAKWGTEEADTALTVLMSQGYKITTRFDERNDCFSCWLIPPEKGENAGFILAGRGSTPMKAIKQMSYLHFKVFDGVWGSEDLRHASEIDD